MKEKPKNSNLGLNFYITNSMSESWYIYKITAISVTLIKVMFHSILFRVLGDWSVYDLITKG